MHKRNTLFLLVITALMAVPLQAQQPQDINNEALPLTTSTSAAMYFPKPLTYPQQMARFEAETAHDADGTKSLVRLGSRSANNQFELHL